VSIYVVFRHVHPDNSTMEDVKKALHDNDIDFNQLKYWYTDRCRELSVVWRTRDNYQIGLLVEGAQCIVVFWKACLCERRVLFISTINWDKNNYFDQLFLEILEHFASVSSHTLQKNSP